MAMTGAHGEVGRFKDGHRLDDAMPDHPTHTTSSTANPSCIQGTPEQVFSDVEAMGGQDQLRRGPFGDVLTNIKRRQMLPGAAPLACSYMKATTREWRLSAGKWAAYYRKVRQPGGRYLSPAPPTTLSCPSLVRSDPPPPLIAGALLP